MRPSEALPNLSDQLDAIEEAAVGSLEEYLQWIDAPEEVMDLIHNLRAANAYHYRDITEINVVPASMRDPIEGAANEITATIEAMEKDINALAWIMDEVKAKRIEYCKGNCPIVRRLHGSQPGSEVMN